MKKLLLFLSVALGMTACKSHYIYQVYELNSNDVMKQNNKLIYENDDLKLSYDFCSEGGDMSFYCLNKTSKNMYINLEESFFIRNGIAYDYYEDCDYTSTTITTLSKGAIEGASSQLTGLVRSPFNFNKWFIGSATRYTGTSVVQSSGKSNAVTTHAVKTITIPAHSAKMIPSFVLSKKIHYECGEKTSKVNYPSKSSPIISYSENDSPLEVINHIAYSFEKESNNCKTIDNKFYVSSLQNFHEWEIFEKNPNYTTGFSRYDDPCKSTSPKIFKLNDCSKFYNKYTKKKK